jgi:hypothetical protein
MADGTIRALLQHGVQQQPTYVVYLVCLAYRYPAGRLMTSIHKPGKANYTEATVYRPISLLSLLLKTREKSVDRYTRDDAGPTSASVQVCLSGGEIHRNCTPYFATRTENAMTYNETALGAFLEIKRAFL